MTRLYIPFIAMALLLAISVHAETLTILHTNDFHSRIEPINQYDGRCSAQENMAGDCFGGAARLMTAIRNVRVEALNTLLVDGGDQFKGSTMR